MSARFDRFALREGREGSPSVLVYEDAAGGVHAWRAIPLRRIDAVEASAIATEVYPSRGKVVVQAGAVRLEASVDGPGAGEAARAFAEAVLQQVG